MQPSDDNQAPQQSVPTPGWQFTPDGAAQPPQGQPAPPPAAPVMPPVEPSPAAPAPAVPQPQTAAPRAASDNAVSWSASEFIDHHKSFGWYGLLGLIGIVSAGLVYLITKDITSSVMFVVVGVVLGIFAGRKPRTLQYLVDEHGIQIGTKNYAYHEFKSFSVVDEGALSSISLLPLKRFMPAISMFYEPQDEEHIVNVLSAYLPVETTKKDAVDRLMQRIRF